MNFFFGLIIFLVLLSAGYAGFRGAPWVPMHKRDLARVLKLAAIVPGQKFFDLGCGDGRTLCAASRVGAKAVGFEVSLIPFLFALMRKLFGCKFKIFFKDFWSANLGEADIIFIFQIPKIYPKLKTKLEKELKKGARVVAYVWGFDGWTPTVIDKTDNSPTLYLYQR